MTILFSVFLLSLLIIVALAIVHTENLFVAVMLMTIFSLLMASNFFILDAADVALTEAAVGAGGTTVIFLGALALTVKREKPSKTISWFPLVVALIGSALLIYSSFDQPIFGDADAPIHQHVAPWYLEQTPELVDIPNVVTAVLATFRGYDTLGEVFVVFTACIGVLFILNVAPGTTRPPKKIKNIGLRHHLIPKVVGRLVFPFIILFALYVQFHGEYGPGGGFQAGAIFATAFILHALLEGESSALLAMPRNALFAMAASGAILYTMVGLAGIAMGGNFLDYSVLHSNPVAGQQIGIIVIEVGVGITVSGALLSIFHAFAAREPS